MAAEPRLFVALALPDWVRSALACWSGARLGRVPGLRLVADESLHVTLCFLGSRPVAEIGAIASACRVVAPRSPVMLSLGRAVWLPRRRPQVVAVELSDDCGALADTQASLAGALRHKGFYQPEDRPYLGHVTVARVGRCARRSRDELEPPEALRFAATAVTLYRSWLGSGPARYEALATITLDGDASGCDPAATSSAN